ncbi:DNA helicase IV [Actinomyces bovis]|uniref:DNA 3'-5' helicase n=1 Tax=Actinomyces bovis TaxID=1658 RepID=A0ABY1VMN9_9ACTO|nr:UrvD/REP family ATP-dependent DNA helicase [Actinomyces bovis]SPT52737.1 DNA helicase IV [Actinomyces bovis]VEG54718.1 DNA helicase IV [Actinomyces israelii]
MSIQTVAPTVGLLPPQPLEPLPALDKAGSQVLQSVKSGGNLVVLGAAGTGKTTVALHALADAVAVGREAVLLSPTRARADRLRERAATALDQAGPGSGKVRVRTPTRLALDILTIYLTRRPNPLPPPVLLAGPEEDAALAEILGTVTWPDLPPEAIESRAFRNELRNILARAGELGVGAEELAELGRVLDVPIWAPVSALLRTWDAQGRASASRRSEVRKVDPARLQDRAAEALRDWHLEDILEAAPVPELVIVDDYQDCTAATARLLSQLTQPDAQGHRSQMLVLGDPDVAVETFRGGAPSLLAEAQSDSTLAAQRLVLTTRHRGNEALLGVWQDQAARVPVTGKPDYRQAPIQSASGQQPGEPLQTAPMTGASQAPGAAKLAASINGGKRSGEQAPGAMASALTRPTSIRPAPTGVEAVLASSPVQEAAQVARVLRTEHVHHLTPWGQMAVVVRSTGILQAVAGELRRRGVPLAAVTPAVLLRAEPAAAALLAVARAALEDQLGKPGSTLPEHGSIMTLLSSPLVGLSQLDLRRLRRHLRDGQAAESSPDQYLLELVGDDSKAAELARDLDGTALRSQAELLARAARIVAAVRRQLGTAVQDSGADGSAQGSGPDVESLLWAAWDASGCAQCWQATALGLPEPQPAQPNSAAGPPSTSSDFKPSPRLASPAQPSSSRPAQVDELLQEAAEHNLDVVTALFKRAEIWAERHPGAPARDFLAELSAEVLPSDSVAPHGIRPEGVQVLTPASAAGGEWELVVVMGLCRDSWPDLRLRDSLTRSGLLVDAVTGRLPLGPDGFPKAELEPTSAPAQVRGDERRMLLAALTRARRRLLVTAVADSDNAPSAFIMEIAQAAGTPVLDADGEPIIQPDVGDLTLSGLVSELRQALVAGNLPEAKQSAREHAGAAARLLAELAQQGVTGADPGKWLGVNAPSTMAPLVAPGQPVQVSPSDVESLTACPLRWFLQRNGAGAPPSAAQQLGNLVHQVAEEAELQDLGRQQLLDRFESLLPSLGYPETWLGQVAKAQARAIAQRLATYLDSTPGKAKVEARVRAEMLLSPPAGQDGPTVPVLITGKIDRLEAQPGESPAPQGKVRLIDLKTGQRAYADPSHHPQLATYRLALEANGYEVDGAALVLLGKEPPKRDGGAPVLAPTGAALAPNPDPETGEDWARALLRQAAIAASGSSLEARTGEQCRNCTVKDSCPIQPEGRRTIA